MNTIDDSTGVALGLISVLLFLALYVWTSLALSAVFRKSGEEGWKAWVPFLNQFVLLELGRLSGWLVLLLLVPFAGPVIVWLLLIVAYYRINQGFGHGIGMTVLAALVLPVWASILGFGPARWLGTDLVSRGASGGGPRRTPAPDDTGDFVPRATPLASSPSAPPSAAPPPSVPAGGWTPPPVPPAPVPTITAAPPLPPTPASAADSWGPSAPPSPAPESAPQIAGRSTRQPSPSPAEGGGSERWGGFDLGAVSEVTSEVTGADAAAPAPVSAVPTRRSGDLPLIAAVPPVTRIPTPGSSGPADEPWAPARSPMPEGDGFSDTSGQISAVAGAPDAGTPRSARTSVSAQHTKSEIPDDPLDATIITRRRRTAWSLVPPAGAPVPITGDVVLLGRKPTPDRAYPDAQLISIDDGTVSKTHARLALREDRWYVTDLGSTNGVLFATLMGTEVEATPGEEFEAGERFFLGDAEVRLQRSDG
jgi:hypothetical protein